MITAGISTGEYGLMSTNLGLYKTNEKINYAVGLLSNDADGQLLRSKNRNTFHNKTFSGSMNMLLGKTGMLLYKVHSTIVILLQKITTPHLQVTLQLSK